VSTKLTNHASEAELEAAAADPVTTEVVRHGLNSAANQMKTALIRTAFSPIIYEVLDFAVAIYDRQVRLLAQAPSLPIFMGTMSFCVEGAVAAIGGESALEPGDIILYNIPYGTGSHQPDAAIVMPVFYHDDVLIGYTTIKGHWLDIGAKDPYSTDTVDVFQEGTVYPGVRLYKGGVLNEDLYRMVVANSRMPKALAGDMNAEIVGCKAGAAALLRVVERYGLPRFNACVERMYDRGEAVVRRYIQDIPDGRYVAQGQLDSDGITDDPVPFEIVVDILGDHVRLDFSNAPDALAGPLNCPYPSTVSGSRIAISMLAGNGEAPNEGHFRPLEVVTRPGSMFHPLPPSPTFLYGWPCLQAIDVIYRAVAEAVPGAVPAGSGGDICSLVWWGTREATGETWVEGSPHPVGQGASVLSDGGTMLHFSESATRFTPVEVWEAKNPWLLEHVELVADSGGAGRLQGGQGIDMAFRMLEDAWVTSVVERTLTPPWGLEGGRPGRANAVETVTEGVRQAIPGKITRLGLRRGTVLELKTGGGGGYGPPGERPAEAVRADIANGYITPGFAREFYPHVEL
jgi:N-methylhydantoinase B